jgi:hypothetical protein
MNIVHDFNHPLHRLLVWVEGGMAALRHKPDYMTVEQYEDTKKTYAQLETLIEKVAEWQKDSEAWINSMGAGDLYSDKDFKNAAWIILMKICDFGKERE